MITRLGLFSSASMTYLTGRVSLKIKRGPKGPLVASDSTGIRTPDRLLRRQLLYPAELSNHHFCGRKDSDYLRDFQIFGEIFSEFCIIGACRLCFRQLALPENRLLFVLFGCSGTHGNLFRCGRLVELLADEDEVAAKVLFAHDRIGCKLFAGALE